MNEEEIKAAQHRSGKMGRWAFLPHKPFPRGCFSLEQLNVLNISSSLINPNLVFPKTEPGNIYSRIKLKFPVFYLSINPSSLGN